MNIEIEEIPAYRVAYIRRTGSYGVENIEIMEQLKNWAKSKNLLNEQATILAIIHDNPQTIETENCRYDACIIISDDYIIEKDNTVSDGIISSGKYAVFQVKHTAEEIQKAMSEIFSELQNKGLSLNVNNPIIERYSIEMVNNHFCEICLPIL